MFSFITNFSIIWLSYGYWLLDIESICINCGLEEAIPGFIYDEMGGKQKNTKN